MTPSDLRARVTANLERPPGVTFDPLTLLILEAAISAAVSWLVTKCLDKMSHEDVKAPGFVQQFRLRRIVREQIRRVSREVKASNNVVPGTANYQSLAEPIHAALIKTGASLTPAEFTALKGH